MKKLAITVFFDAFALMLLGLIIVMSASSTYSVIRFDSVFHLFNSHLFKVGVAFFFMIMFSMIPYEIYKDYCKPALIVITVVLLITLIIAPNIKGAGRWLNLGIVSVQPADIARLLLLIHLAFMLEDKQQILDNYRHGFLPMFIWIIGVSALITFQPNISTGILLILISLTVLYVGGAKIKHIFTSLLAVITFGAVAAMIYPHSRERIFTFFNSITKASFSSSIPLGS